MARIRITISADGLTADAVIVAGPAMQRTELEELLRANEVRFGQLTDVIHALAQNLGDPTHASRCVVATGNRPIDGADGEVRLDFSPAPKAGTSESAGTIDHHERHLLRPIRVDQRIASIVPPTSGEAGTSVRGASIPPRAGRPHRVRFGAGVRVAADGIFATRDGVLASDPNRLDVVLLFQHAGDVDYRTGNLHSQGSLAVSGDVLTGFTVQAAHDVHVGGAVLDACVIASGSVQIDQGVLGPASTVQAGASLTCRHATSATLCAGTQISIADQAIHCLMRADSIVLQTGRGALIGGEARVRSSIVVRSAGTAVGAPTLLVVADVGDDSIGEPKNARRTHPADRREAAGAGKPQRLAPPPPAAAPQETLRLRQLQRELLRTARIEITETLHPGVHVVFGDQERHYNETRTKLCLRWSESENAIIEEALP